MTQVSVVAPDGGEAIQLGEIAIPPGTAGPPQHRRAQLDEGFYVVSGTARFTVGDTSYDAVAGPVVMVPPRDQGQMIADGQPLIPESTEQAMRRYATETLS
jgi:mannose-6-phosphate isomerase-like protein (cupin superfamily)